ncbi:MAG TPA: COX15/CtaA family protein, partial [Lautropia sp.]|nr:COX15/CtaA family protein [Lautropia sp.]
PIVVQFVHRWLAFVVAAFVIWLGLRAWRGGLSLPATAVIGSVTVQILLGIATLLSGVELWIAVAHQAMAALLLAAIVVTAHQLGQRRTA